MKISLKLKLTISYIALSLFLVLSLLTACNYFLEKKFQNYIIDMQEKKNKNIVNMVVDKFDKNGKAPEEAVLESIGNTALSQGLVLMVNNAADKQLFCMSDIEGQVCSNMIESMSKHMSGVYPGFNGRYVQKRYDMVKDGQKIGVVTLGYYGPFYYNDEDVQFLRVLNRIFISISILFLVIAGLVGYVMANRISKPIRKVIHKTKQIEIGNYSDRLTLTSNTKEIAQLIHSVNSLEETLERQQLSKRRMARDYAHELRTPLAALQSNLEAMIDGIWEPTGERLESCRAEIIRLTRMISDLDKLVKMEENQDDLFKMQFDLSHVVNQVILNFQPEMEAKQINIQSNVNSCVICADQDKITQVVVNLLSNAVKYTDEGGKIRVIVKQRGKKAELILSDTGIGISAEDLPNIFEYLYRTDKSRNRDTGGSGIGLSVVKAIVEAHGGTMEVKSELGRGSEFKLTLPMEDF